MVPAQFEYSITDISGERNCWGDLLSRWVDVPAVKLRAMAVFAPSEPGDTMPSKELVRPVQQSAREKVKTRAHGAAVFMASHGQAEEDGGAGIFRIKVKGGDVM